MDQNMDMDPSNTEEQELGPRRVGNAKLIFKTLMGIVGGIAGTLVILIVYLLASSLIFFDPTASVNLVQLYIVLMMVFLATIIGNLVSVMLFFLVDREKYQKLTTLLTQSFIFNLLIFIFSVPLYFIIQGTSITTLIYIVGVHFLLSAFITSIVMEILSSSTYVLVVVYGNTLGILAALVVNVILFMTMPSELTSFLLFLTLPIIWGAIGFFQSVAEMVYRWLYDTYGIDFLSKETQYEDEEKTEGEEEKSET